MVTPVAASSPLDRPTGAPRESRATGVGRVGWLATTLLTGALGLRLALWDRAYGFEQGDPVEYVNIAYRIAFGIGIEWWDLRPLALSLLYVPVMLAMQWWPDPTGEAMVRALRLVGVLFGLGVVALTYGIGRRLGGEIVGLAAGLLVAANPVANRMSVSTFAEVPSTYFVLLAVWLLVRGAASHGRPVATQPPRTSGPGESRLPVVAGLALGAACMIRYQAIAYVAPFAVWVLACDLTNSARPSRPSALLNRRSLTVRFGLGLAVAVAAQAIVETVAYGRPFHSLMVSYQYNVTSGLAPVEFGAEPFDWFVRQAPAWFGILPALLALVGASALARGPRAAEWRLVGLATATMFLVLSALPHKEERFMTQVVPLLALFAGAGVSRVARLRALAWGERGWDAGGRDAGGRDAGGRVVAAALALAAAAPLLWASWELELRANVAYADGPKRAAELKPGGTLGTIPWFVPRPYTGTRLVLERMDRRVWADREQVARTIEQSDFLLIPEYWLLEDPAVDHLVTAGFRNLESYDNGVALYQNRRLVEPPRRRQR